MDIKTKRKLKKKMQLQSSQIGGNFPLLSSPQPDTFKLDHPLFLQHFLETLLLSFFASRFKTTETKNSKNPAENQKAAKAKVCYAQIANILSNCTPISIALLLLVVVKLNCCPLFSYSSSFSLSLFTGKFICLLSAVCCTDRLRIDSA